MKITRSPLWKIQLFEDWRSQSPKTSQMVPPLPPLHHHLHYHRHHLTPQHPKTGVLLPDLYPRFLLLSSLALHWFLLQIPGLPLKQQSLPSPGTFYCEPLTSCASSNSLWF